MNESNPDPRTEVDAVAFLGPESSPVLRFLREVEPRVVNSSEPVCPEFVTVHRVGFIVSYGYRHLVRRSVLDAVRGRAINLHISYLPWNRGADPNLWSFVEGTPKGVTIHFLDEGVDTGDVIVQERLEFDRTETLASSYEKLCARVERLFREHWRDVRTGRCGRTPQVGTGSTHRSRDRERVAHLLTHGWQTAVSALDSWDEDIEISRGFWDRYDAERTAEG